MLPKIVIVTGASRGIGSATAKKFAKEGFHLALCSSSSSAELEETAEKCRSFGVQVETWTCDVSDSKSVDTFISGVLEKYGHVDVLVNNAGISYTGLLTEMSDDEWHKIMGINLDSMFYTSRRLIPSMIKQGFGSIVNVSSVWGTFGASCEVAYSASKGGVNALTKALAEELEPSNIMVNAISCGFIDTHMNSHLSIDEINELCKDIPIGRMIQPKEVADCIFSTAISQNTGRIVDCDGGWRKTLELQRNRYVGE